MRIPFFILSTCFICVLTLFSCHSSKMVSGDNKDYHDDSLIEMKTIERKARMPFDTAAPVPRKPQQTENKTLPTE
jgi:hypothetical protein